MRPNSGEGQAGAGATPQASSGRYPRADHGSTVQGLSRVGYVDNFLVRVCTE